MEAKRKVDTPEFKLQAVQMVADQKLSGAEAARRLGLPESRHREWAKPAWAEGADAFPGSGHQAPAEEELRRLRADVKRLDEMGRDILKKATAFFAALSE